jgi:hypothetical protein
MYYFLIFIPLIAACQYLPEVTKEIESIATDKAIVLEISRETFQKDTDMSISINVQNKDEPNKAK